MNLGGAPVVAGVLVAAYFLARVLVALDLRWDRRQLHRLAYSGRTSTTPDVRPPTSRRRS